MTKTTLLSIVASLIGLFPAGSQPFQNLGFESAVISGSGGVVDWNAAMPGWTGRIGASDPPLLHYNDQCLSPCTSIAIVDRAGFTWGNPLLGTYSVILTAGFDLGNRYESSIAQTGLIPSDSQSIRFLGHFNGAQSPIISVAGQAVPLYALNQTANFTVYGADVAAFAGQTAELRFTVATDYDTVLRGGGSQFMLDGILFSANPVPEPSVVLLLLLGGGILALRLNPKLIKAARRRD